MFWNFVRFISILLFTLFACHCYLYLSWLKFFHIDDLKIRKMIGMFMIFGSLSFLISSIFIHTWNNMFTRLCYHLSFWWLGMMGLLIIATVLIWISKGMFLIIAAKHTDRIIVCLTVSLYSICVLYGGYCYYKYYTIKTTEIEIFLPNLPSSWEGQKIIHLSDLHLGGAQDRKFLKKVIKKVNEQNGKVIVITGDLFDGATNVHRRYIDLLKRFQAEHNVLMVSGNHENYSGISASRQAVLDAGITMLDDNIVDLDGMQFVGIAYPQFDQKVNFDIKGNPDLNPNMPSILLYHTPTDIGKNGELKNQSHDYFAPKTHFHNVIEAGISMQLSGHTHGGQFFPFTWLAGKIYNGFHYGLHQINGFQIYVHSGTGSWGPPMRSDILSEIAVIVMRKK